MSNFRPIDRETGFLFPPSVDEWLPKTHLDTPGAVCGRGDRWSGPFRDDQELSWLWLSLLPPCGSAGHRGVWLRHGGFFEPQAGTCALRFGRRARPDGEPASRPRHPCDGSAAISRADRGAVRSGAAGGARDGMLQLGTVALDGTKVQAKASRHSALSYEHATKIEAQLKAEVAELLAKAEAADRAGIPDGLSIPAELARREERLRKLAEARAKINARANERFAREQADYQAKLAARDAKAAASGKKSAGRPPQPPVETPLPTDQINLTDEASRIMPVAGGGFEPCYNAQAVVAAGSLLAA